MKVGFPLAAAMGSILISLAGAQVPPRAQSRLRSQTQPLAQPQPSAQPQPLAQPQPEAAQPATATATPAPPEQMPAHAPRVVFSDGILTITADNSTLGDILRAVHRQTGATVDVPGNATERVVGQFGPGPARDVLASLLNGSHFNYVLLGSETNPTGLEQVVLLSKSADNLSPRAQARLSSPTPAAQPAADSADGSNDDDTEMPTDANEATDDQANQGQGEDQPQAQPPGQPAIKTPEQLLQELQQRQQQMQQQGVPIPPSPMGGTSPPPK